MIKRCVVKWLAVWIALGVFQSSVALQTQLVKENAVVAAFISAKELTRIAVFHDRIRNVYGQEGSYELKNDPTQGALFVKPTTDNLSPFTLFIATEKNYNYVLHLTPQEQLGDTLLLKNRLLLPSTKKSVVVIRSIPVKASHE